MSLHSGMRFETLKSPMATRTPSIEFDLRLTLTSSKMVNIWSRLLTTNLWECTGNRCILPVVGEETLMMEITIALPTEVWNENRIGTWL
jgi:hypothetical protein